MLSWLWHKNKMAEEADPKAEGKNAFAVQLGEIHKMLLTMTKRLDEVEGKIDKPNKRTPTKAPNKRAPTKTPNKKTPKKSKGKSKDDDGDDTEPLTRTPSGTKSTREAVRSDIFRLIDASLLAPEGETRLYKFEGGKFHFQRHVFLAVANSVMQKVGLPATNEHINAFHDLVRQRRNYHQTGWKNDMRHRPLRYGGSFGTESEELKAILKKSVEYEKKSPTLPKKRKSPRKAKSAPKAKSPRKAKSPKVDLTVDASSSNGSSTDTTDIDLLFNSTDTTDSECFQCGAAVENPVNGWEKVRCKACIGGAYDDKAKQPAKPKAKQPAKPKAKRPAKPKAKQPAKPKAKQPPPKPKAAICTGACMCGNNFRKGCVVEAPWHDGVYHEAHVYKVNKNGSVNVYFLDNYTRFNVPQSELRPSKNTRTRQSYIGCEWMYPGDKGCPRGTFTILKEGTGKRANEFLNKRVTGAGNKKKPNVWFTVSYCIDRCRKLGK